MTRAPTALACTACQTSNRPHRGYCRACGASLQPVCRGCLFINDRGDHYCGGCGCPLEGPRAPHDERVSVAAAGTLGAAAAPDLGELAELLQPLAPAPRDNQLPASGITQDDLDRLFGGPR